MARLFFALWPDAPAAEELGRLASALALRTAGRPVPRAKIHLTLAFLGEVAAERVARAASVRIAARAFAMRLDCVGAFRGARVAWAGCAEPPAGLVELQSALARGLEALDFAFEERAFTPHVTLVRRITAAVPVEGIAPVAWQAREFTLMLTEAGTGGYSALQRWALRG